jgi:hypothetical protein
MDVLRNSIGLRSLARNGSVVAGSGWMPTKNILYPWTTKVTAVPVDEATRGARCRELSWSAGVSSNRNLPPL